MSTPTQPTPKPETTEADKEFLEAISPFGNGSRYRAAFIETVAPLLAAHRESAVAQAVAEKDREIRLKRLPKVSVKHVLQEDPFGCLPATLAMVLGITYAEAVAKMGGEASRGHSYYCDNWDQTLGDHGWAVVRKWKVVQPSNQERPIWPLAPWADLHECEVKTGMIHSVLLLRDGTVLDPLTPEPKRLTDYSAVLSMAALYKVADLTALRSANKVLTEEVAELNADLELADKAVGDFTAIAQDLRAQLAASEARCSELEKVMPVPDQQGVQFGTTWLSFDKMLGCLAQSDEARAHFYTGIIPRGLVEWANKARYALSAAAQDKKGGV